MIPLPGIVQKHPLATLIVVALLVRLALTPLYAHEPNGPAPSATRTDVSLDGLAVHAG